MAELNTETLKPEDIRIEYTGGMVSAWVNNICLWSEPNNLDKYEDYNGPVPEDIDLNYRVPHYHDMDTGELYRAYGKILKLIEYVDKQTHSRKRTTDETWTINDLRSYCQTWLDDVRYRQDGVDDRRLWWVDAIKYFLKGQSKKRSMWLNTFGTICFDMCAKLDAIDGGNEEQPTGQINLPQHKIGF